MDHMDHLQTIGPPNFSVTEAMEEALVLHYSGLSIREAFDRVDGAARSTYYQWQKERPDEIEEVKAAARGRAIRKRTEYRLSADAHLEEKGIVAQKAAAQALIEAIPTLALIASGQTWEVEITAQERNTEDEVVNVARRKTVVPYPTAIAGAANTLHAIVKDGFMPEGIRIALQQTDSEGKAGLQPMFQAMTDFTSVKAVKADGSSVEITRDDGDVIDAEVMDEEAV
jgi:hypothetical protein